MSNLVKGIEKRTETIILRNNTVKREKGGKGEMQGQRERSLKINQISKYFSHLANNC